MGAGTPEMQGQPQSGLKHTPTPASAQVQRTNLQPQVDAKPSDTMAGAENDAIGALDAQLRQFDNALPPESEKTPRVNNFRLLWQQLKAQWEQIKTQDMEGQMGGQQALGNDGGDQRQRNAMQTHPNMVPTGPNQPGEGPGTFGNY